MTNLMNKYICNLLMYKTSKIIHLEGKTSICAKDSNL